MQQKTINYAVPFIACLYFLLSIPITSWAELTVYSARKEHLIKPLLDQFAYIKNIKIKLVTGKDEALIERIRTGKEDADVLFLADAGNLNYAAQKGVLQPFRSTLISKLVPAEWQANTAEGIYWTALSLRARTIIYNSNNVTPDQLSSYEQLAAPAWKGRLCLRTSKKVYNKSLISSFILYHGKEKTKEIIKGWVTNLAAKPFAKDSQVIKAVLHGQCDIGIVNTYYLGREQAQNAKYAVKLFWANQSERGTHVNVSGAGIVSGTNHPELSKQLIEWLLSPEAQSTYARSNKEYPILDNIELDPIVSAWGPFKKDATSLHALSTLQLQAIKLMREAGYQ